MRKVLIAGCGDEGQQWLDQGWEVVRLDIDERTNPDVVGDMRDLGDIGQFDAISCNNALEHVYPHEIHKTLCGFHRNLKEGGHLIIQVPDLEGIEATDEIISEIGMSGLHLIYGDPARLEEFPYMAHHCGFVEDTLRDCLSKAGFDVTTKRLPCHQLMGIGVK